MATSWAMVLVPLSNEELGDPVSLHRRHRHVLAHVDNEGLRSSAAPVVEHVVPALWCVMVLSLLFFSVYLFLVCVRACRSWTKQVHDRLVPVLMKVADDLIFVPMLCILMISARIWEWRYDRRGGGPPLWAQYCMYACVAALFVRLAMILVAPQPTRGGPHAMSRSFDRLVWIGRCGASVVFYGCCAAIVVSILLMQVPKMGPMTCVVFLTVLYFVQYFLTEVYTALRGSDEDAPEAAAAARQLRVGTLQFIPMYCILLVGISLRSVQLHLQPSHWARAAMLTTTGVILVQAVTVPLSRICLPAGAVDEVVEAGEDVSFFTWPRRTGRPLIVVCSIGFWMVLVAIQYAGIILTLASVFTMEEQPMVEYWPGEELELWQAPVGPGERISSAMKCTMLLTVIYFGVFLCLMVERITCGPACQGAISARVRQAHNELQMAEERLQASNQGDMERADAERLKEEVAMARDLLNVARCTDAQVQDGLQRSLAFAPMLCVMMIGVRMRAIQLHVENPPVWSQIMMYLATFSVTIQVVTSVLYAYSVLGANSDSDLVPSFGSMNVVEKVLAIALLVLRYVAAICLYVSMIALVVAMLVMEPSS